MICGWCKTEGLKLVRLAVLDPESGETVRMRETVLQSHIVNGTTARACKGFETYIGAGTDGSTPKSK